MIIIDEHILYESNTRWKNLAMAWIDCRNTLYGSAKQPQNIENVT